MKLNAIRVATITLEGKISSQGASSISEAPLEISVPREVSGSCTPMPRKLSTLSVMMTSGMVRVT